MHIYLSISLTFNHSNILNRSISTMNCETQNKIYCDFFLLLPSLFLYMFLTIYNFVVLHLHKIKILKWCNFLPLIIENYYLIYLFVHLFIFFYFFYFFIYLFTYIFILLLLTETALLNFQFYLRSRSGSYSFSEHLPDMGKTNRLAKSKLN